MSIETIKNESDYQEALERLELIFDSEKETPEGDELELLGALIERYEYQTESW